MTATVLAGLALGSSYALLAIGFTLVFGVLRRVDLAYGASIMLGIYGALRLCQEGGFGPLAMPPATLAITLAAGAYVERLCFAPHANRADVTAMAASFAVWMQFEELATLLVPRHAAAVPTPFADASTAVLATGLRLEHLIALGGALAAGAGLWTMLRHSRFGLAVRALIVNPEAAACAGINVPRLSALIFSLASGLGAIAGTLIVSMDGQVTPMFAMWATLKGLIAAILGGLGSLPGAIAGGLLLGLIETAAQSLLGPQLRDLCGYILLFAVLSLCPAGLSALWRNGERRRIAAEA